MAFILLLLFPVFIPMIAVFVFHRTITLLESLATIAIVIIGVSIIYWAGSYAALLDTEILNGQITGKKSEHVSCSHSYSCHCRTVYSGSGKDRTSSTVCDTCYEHSYDVDWIIETTLGDFTIPRVDRQGLLTPPRWELFMAGQPFAKQHKFVNYVKNAPDSIFHRKIVDNHFLIPEYPLNIYNYQYIDRAISVGVPMTDLANWNRDISNILIQLGSQKEANIVMVFVNSPDSNYSEALKNAWQNGKKNDIIVVIGTTKYPNIDWVRVIGWSKNEIFNVKLRDDILELGQIDRNKIIPIIASDTAKLFQRTKMADYEYLKYSIQPPAWLMTLCFFAEFFGTIGLLIYFHKNDILG